MKFGTFALGQAEGAVLAHALKLPDGHRLKKGTVLSAEDIATLRSVRDHEGELRELVEQQRATRARLEERMSQAEELIAELASQVAESTQARAVLQRQIAGEAEQRRVLVERIEAQRDTFIEHMRRQARAQEDSHRRLIEDVERDIRTSRQLLVKLSEDTDESEQEQPL